MILHTHIPKRKKKKPDAKARKLKSSWQDILNKYEIDASKTNKNKLYVEKSSSTVIVTKGRTTTHIPSLKTTIGTTTKKATPKYTGENMLGISVLHKSNGVPVFRDEDIKDISKMRRG